jgi:hypothetical protein
MMNIFKKKKPKQKVVIPNYILFNVENFNNWFNAPKESYANPGIFLRLDKFGIFIIREYLSECYGLDMNIYEYSIINKFEQDIRNVWKQKLTLKN